MAERRVEVDGGTLVGLSGREPAGSKLDIQRRLMQVLIDASGPLDEALTSLVSVAVVLVASNTPGPDEARRLMLAFAADATRMAPTAAQAQFEIAAGMLGAPDEGGR